MEFLIPLPDHQYYLWQMLVQVAHFRELGYEQDAHYLVVYFDQPSQTLRRLFESDELRCYIHAYPDTRADRGYSASMYCNHVSPAGGQELVEETLKSLKELAK